MKLWLALYADLCGLAAPENDCQPNSFRSKPRGRKAAEEAKIRHDAEASLISAASLILLKPSSQRYSAELKGDLKWMKPREF